jgi:hypothetical protein
MKKPMRAMQSALTTGTRLVFQLPVRGAPFSLASGGLRRERFSRDACWVTQR